MPGSQQRASCLAERGWGAVGARVLVDGEKRAKLLNERANPPATLPALVATEDQCLSTFELGTHFNPPLSLALPAPERDCAGERHHSVGLVQSVTLESGRGSWCRCPFDCSGADFRLKFNFAGNRRERGRA